MKNTIKKNLFCNYYILCFGLLLISITYTFNEELALDLLKFFILIEIFLFIILSFRANGFLAIYSLFLCTSVLFIFSRVYFGLVNYLGRDINDFYFFESNVYFSDGVVFEFLLYSCIYLILIDFSYYFSKPKLLKRSLLLDNERAKKILNILLLLIIPILLYKSYLDIRVVANNGYSSLINRTNYPFFVYGSGTLFLSLFYARLMFKSSKKQYVYLILIFVLVSLSSSLRGSRSIFMMSVIAGFYILWRLELFNISVLKIFIIFISGLGIIILMTAFLRGEQGFIDLPIYNMVNYILYGQSNSIGIPLFYLEHKEYIEESRDIPFLLGDLFSHYTSEIVSGDRYINSIGNVNNIEGAGLGSSLYFQLLDLPFFFDFIFCVFFGYFMKFVEINLLRNKYFMPLLLIIANWLVVMPRFAFFDFLEVHNVITAFLAVVLAVFTANLSKSPGRYYARDQ